MPAQTRRTTTPKSNIIDLDAMLGEEISTVPLKPVAFKLFGETFHADGNYNVIRLLTSDLESSEGLDEQLRQMLVPKDRDRFIATLAAQPRLTVPATVAIINKITELVAGRPTQ